MDTTTTSSQQFQFPVRSTWRMPCQHWQQFPVRRTCTECVDDFCDKCRLNLPPYKFEEKNLEYQHQQQFHNFIHQHTRATTAISERCRGMEA